MWETFSDAPAKAESGAAHPYVFWICSPFIIPQDWERVKETVGVLPGRLGEEAESEGLSPQVSPSRSPPGSFTRTRPLPLVPVLRLSFK
jgi:hypothetical protein